MQDCQTALRIGGICHRHDVPGSQAGGALCVENPWARAWHHHLGFHAPKQLTRTDAAADVVDKGIAVLLTCVQHGMNRQPARIYDTPLEGGYGHNLPASGCDLERDSSPDLAKAFQCDTRAMQVCSHRRTQRRSDGCRRSIARHILLGRHALYLPPHRDAIVASWSREASKIGLIGSQIGPGHESATSQPGRDFAAKPL